ncbi:MAG: hypothetical protein DYG94_09715 [Leptolyngbya sp. PLA3]|nr:MAG: hypothetical protein EDM82_07980 [Cyanobacteria bacterium CYA]MCE7969006.1 hypothetical protein [Leptolyngbya sp. PL-A3]
MAGGARVTSIAALREFRPAIIKFVEEARAALIAAEADASRTIDWLRRDQAPFWKKEIRRRQDVIVQAKTDLFNKQRTASGDPRSAVEERKALELAQRRLEDAETRAANTQHWIRQLEKEHMAYKGAAQMLSSQLVSLEDKALYDLDRMSAALEEYVAIQTPTLGEMGEAPEPRGLAKAAGESFADRDRLRDARPSPYAVYRQATPGPGRRRRAEPLGSPEAYPAHDLSRVDRIRQSDMLLELDPAETMDMSLWVRLSPGVLDAERVYLERTEPVDAEDSGWYVGPAENDRNPEPERRELDRVRLSDLIALRPPLETVFRLARGTLVIVRGAGVESVTLPNDTLAFPRETPP